MIMHIVAIDNARGLAKDGAMPPWHLKKDEAYFTEQTKTRGGITLMGRKTFTEALHGHPFTDRTNYIVSRDPTPIPGAQVVNGLEKFVQEWPEDKDLWIIGGSEIFVQTLDYADELYITEIEANYDCDRFYPEYKQKFKLARASDVQEEHGVQYRFCVYTK